MNILSKILWTAGKLLPIDKKKIVLTSFYGRGCADSPKAIACALHEKDPTLKLVCLTDKKHLNNIPNFVIPKSYGILSRIYHLSSAKVWIDNNRKAAGYKKKNQFYLQTWHGFALKRIEKDVGSGSDLDRNYAAYCKKDSAQTDLYVSGSRHMTNLYKNSFWYNGAVSETGTPRNDILFCDDHALRTKVCKWFGIDNNKKIILYAPTFRANHSTDCYQIDCQRIIQACMERFGGEWVVLIRLHPSIDTLSDKLFSYDGTTIINATAYDDVQELLCCTDLLITDYSSIIFDFALTDKPCIQFATDIEAYKNDRNFYFPIDTLPFPLSVNNDQLCDCIKSYDRTQTIEKWKAFASLHGFCEDGHASERCADIILSHLK